MKKNEPENVRDSPVAINTVKMYAITEIAS